MKNPKFVFILMRLFLFYNFLFAILMWEKKFYNEGYNVNPANTRSSFTQFNCFPD